MRTSSLRFCYVLMGAGLLINGCNKGSQPTPPPNPSPPVANCPPAKTMTVNAQDSMDADLKAPFLELPNTDPYVIPAFEVGDELFGKSFTAAQGGGSNVDGHDRYTRVPRADRTCPGEWATHFKRATGPNSKSCVDCHSHPNDGAGPVAVNAVRDPLHSHDFGQFIQRNTPHLFGIGAMQLLGEEMTEELQGIKEKAGDDACQTKKPVKRRLEAKGVYFGTIKATCSNGKASFNSTRIRGVSPDLVVLPLQWKKTVKTIRDFVLDAARNEIGMQGVEEVGLDKDLDGDGVVNELTVSQVTALTVYMALQPRPVTRVELTDAGILTEATKEQLQMKPVASDEERAEIAHGSEVFTEIGCDVCHKPQMTLVSTQFTEPNGDYGAVHFDLAEGGPDNMENGKNFGAFTEKDANGQTIVRLYGDLKWHNMGPELAENIDEPGPPSLPKGIGRSTFGTKELWGVGCTGPWLHDGRASTLTEAILYHGGEAKNSRNAFKALDQVKRKALFEFLYNQVLYLREADEEPSALGFCGEAEDEPENI